jgi:hypothetical protein
MVQLIGIVVIVVVVTAGLWAFTGGAGSCGTPGPKG